jgi:adenylosuccinate lyase
MTKPYTEYTKNRDELADLLKTLSLIAPSVAKIVEANYLESHEFEAFKGIDMASKMTVGFLADLEEAINN